MTADTTIEIQGTMFPVTLDRRRLTFSTSVGDVEVSGASKEELEERIRRELARQKVEIAIPVVLQMDQRLVRAILRGKSQRTAEYLFTIDGKKNKIEYPRIVALEISDEALARGNTLIAEHVRAGQALNAWFQQLLTDQSASLDHTGKIAPWELIRAAERKAGVTP